MKLMKILDGKKTAQKMKNKLRAELKKLNLKPGLAVVLVGNDPASEIYIRHKEKAAREIGINFFLHKLPQKTTEKKLLEVVKKLNKQNKVHGIIVQLPLPKHINSDKVIETVLPTKDVDGFHPINAGNLAQGNKTFVPATAMGILELLDNYKIEIKGKHCVVVGRSNIVGKPVSLLLLERHATITICHSRTKDLGKITKQADILIAAVGRPNLIKKSMIKPGVVIVDVGINRLSNGKIVGDVEFESCRYTAGAISPVPGGAGPMTIASLMKSCLEAAKKFK